MSIKYLYDRKKIAVTYGEQKYSYADVIKYVNYYSEFLDISKGDRVALMMENRPESIFSFFSIWAKKGIALSLDAGYTVEQLAFVLNDSKPKYIFVSNKVKEVVEKANEKIGNIVKILVVDEISLPDNYIPKQEEYHNDSDEEVAIIVYTSGTTGNPKGVMITYENIRANMDGITAANLVNDTDSILAMLPYHHIMPLCFTLILPMYLGVPVILLTEISSASLLKTLQENVVTVILGVPRVWEMLDKAIMTKINESSLARFMFKMASKINSMSIRKMLFSKVHKQFGGHIRLMVSGGAKIDKNILEDFRTMGFRAIQGYGMTETAPIITFNVPGRERSDSAGEVIPDVEVKITDDGEILVKGKNVMKGYYNNEQATKEAFDEDGWFHTGDLGRMEGKYLIIIGRKKEMIVLSNGKNINPIDIETKLMSMTNLIAEIVVTEYNSILTAVIHPDFNKVKEEKVDNIYEVLKWAVVDKYNQKTPDYKKTGIPFISVENIDNIYNTEKYISEEDYEKNYRIKPKIDDIFMTRIGTIGKCAIVTKNNPLAYYVSLALLRPNKNKIDSAYLKYIIESGIGKKELNKRILFTAVPIKINKGDIDKLEIPLPPLEVQKRIVGVLDNFEKICNDLNIGLPAEIEARQKQYEFYRNFLLTFKIENCTLPKTRQDKTRQDKTRHN